MFTGLITELGVVASINKKQQSALLSIKAPDTAKDAAIGDSIAVNGVCLTVVKNDGAAISFDVSFETLKSSNLGEFKQGDRVNLEPSLTPNSKIGGHFVAGHIESVGKIISKQRTGDAVKVEIEAAASIIRYLVPKGSVTIDGISLTVVDVNADSFSVVIIPHTAFVTTIGFKKTGDTVNLEPDILAKYVFKFLSGREGKQDNKSGDEMLIAALSKSGFIR
jgi:riboflavin synthase